MKRTILLLAFQLAVASAFSQTVNLNRHCHRCDRGRAA